MLQINSHKKSIERISRENSLKPFRIFCKFTIKIHSSTKVLHKRNFFMDYKILYKFTIKHIISAEENQIVNMKRWYQWIKHQLREGAYLGCLHSCVSWPRGHIVALCVQLEVVDQGFHTLLFKGENYSCYLFATLYNIYSVW